jgi:chorismate synthase
MMLRFLTAGESHGPELLVIVEGLPAGVDVQQEAVDADLLRRQQGYGRGARSTKIERDHAEIVSGLAGGRTTGAPVGIRIANRDFANQPPTPKPLTAPRPGHADLAGGIKYGLADFRLIRERASARETAARVAAGALARSLLGALGTEVGSFVTAVGDVAIDVPLGSLDEGGLWALARSAEDDPVRCPDASASARMVAAVDAGKGAGETLGGVFVVFATGTPPGLGSHVHWDRRLDGRLLGAIGSIQAVKGAEVGEAFALARVPGTQAVDSIVRGGGADGGGRDGLERPTNRAGGLEGGITNGRPVVVRGAMKPLSSVRREVESIDLASGEPVDPAYVRSDVCAVPAAAVVGEAMLAWVLADAMVERFGGDRLDAMRAALDAARSNGRWTPPPPPGRGTRAHAASRPDDPDAER